MNPDVVFWLCAVATWGALAFTWFHVWRQQVVAQRTAREGTLLLRMTGVPPGVTPVAIALRDANGRMLYVNLESPVAEAERIARGAVS